MPLQLLPAPFPSLNRGSELLKSHETERDIMRKDISDGIEVAVDRRSYAYLLIHHSIIPLS